MALRRLSALTVLILCLNGLTRADEAGAKRHFNAVRLNAPELVAFLSAMPKGADLHIHTSGALYAEDSLKEAIKLGLFYNPGSHLFQKTSVKGCIPAAKLAEHSEELNQFLSDSSMRGYSHGGAAAHDHFFATFDYFGSAWSGAPTIDELKPVLRRAEGEHLLYLELMMGIATGKDWARLEASPVDLRDYNRALDDLAPGIKAFLAGSHRYLDSVDADLGAQMGLSHATTGTSDPVSFRYVATINRNIDNATFFIQAAAEMAAIRSDPRVVSLTILAPEDDPRSQKNFQTQMKILDFLWRQLGRPNLNLHGGELTSEIASPDDMRDRIRTTITLGHARRVGHAVALEWDSDPKSLLALMKQRGIAVECCLTSNDFILNVKGSDHPFWMYFSHGVPVTLDTDDEGVSRSNMTLEYAKAVRDQHISYRQLKQIDRNGLEYSFLPGASLYVSVGSGSIRPEFRSYLSGGRMTGKANQELAGSQKMQMELRLETQMRAFEARF